MDAKTQSELMSEHQGNFFLGAIYACLFCVPFWTIVGLLIAWAVK